MSEATLVVTAAGPGPEPPAAPPDQGALERRRTGIVRVLLRNPGLALSVVVVATALAWAVVPAAFRTHDPLATVTAERLRGPSAAHWFGTDELGRDVYSRMVEAAALSLQATALAVLIGLVVGTTVGVVGGTLGGRVDDALMRLVDVLLAVPGLLLALSIVTVLGFGTINVAVAVGVAAVAAFARVARSEVIRVMAAPYVEAAVSNGLRMPAIMVRHVLPNSAGPVLVLAALEFGSAVLAVSALSFLGFGAAPPAPEWGSLVADGRNFIATAWWLTTFPGLVVVAVVLAANRVSRAAAGEVRR
jgi:peptide/nickel transport system permease protein